MKTIYSFLLFLFLQITVLKAQDQFYITIEFENVENKSGEIFLALYDNKKDFLKNPISGKIIKTVDDKAIVVLKDIPKGTYAISSFYDKNGNKKLDTNFIGIPKEPIGISNNATGFMGPPTYSDAKFTVTKNIYLKIKLI